MGSIDEIKNAKKSHDTATLKAPEISEDFDFDSAMCSLTLQCDAHRGV